MDDIKVRRLIKKSNAKISGSGAIYFDVNRILNGQKFKDNVKKARLIVNAALSK